MKYRSDYIKYYISYVILINIFNNIVHMIENCFY